MSIEIELDLARNMFGSLGPEIRERLQRLYDNPCVETWEDAYCIIVGHDRWMTLWQAVIAVDPTFPQRGRSTDRNGEPITEWNRVPDRALIRQALFFATH